MSYDGYYRNTVATIAVDEAVEIAELCMLAGRPDRIVLFLNSRLTPDEVKDRLTAEATPATPAEDTTRGPAAGSSPANGRRSVTAADLERAAKARFKVQNTDPLAAAIERRLQTRRAQ